MFKLILLAVVVLQLSTCQVDGGGLLGGGGLGLNNFALGRIGNLGYGRIGSIKKGRFLGIPVSHIGGLYGKSLLLSPNPGFEDGYQYAETYEPEAQGYQFEDMDNGGAMLANPTPMGGNPFVDRSFEAAQMAQQQAFDDQQIYARQWADQPTQNFEYAYNDGMVMAENPNIQFEDDQARFFKKGKGYGGGYGKGYGKGHSKGYGKGYYGQSYGPSYGGGYNSGYSSYGGGYGGYAGAYGMKKGYGHKGHGHGGYGNYGGGHGGYGSYGGGYGGYRSASGLEEDAEFQVAAPQQQQQQQQQFFDQVNFERANLQGDPMTFEQQQPTQFRFAPQMARFPTPAAAAVPLPTHLLIDSNEPWQQDGRVEDPQVGSFMDFMGKPFMGLWDPNSKWAEKFNGIELEFPASDGDNNYHEAPDTDYHY